jgi:hypothetical protein
MTEKAPGGMSLPVRIMGSEGGTANVDDGRGDMSDHDGVLMMQRLLLAGTLGLAMARKAAAILDGSPAAADLASAGPASAGALMPVPVVLDDDQPAPDSRSHDGAVLRAILDAANDCLGHFDDRPPAERWCDALLQLLDLAAFAADLGSAS